MFSEYEDNCLKNDCPKGDFFCYHKKDAAPTFAYCAHCSLIPHSLNKTCKDLDLSKEGLKHCKARCEKGILEIL